MLSQSEHGDIPVVEDSHSRRLVGSLNRGDVLDLYNREVLHRDILGIKLGRENSPDREVVGLPSEYLVEVLPVPPAFVGKTLAELGLVNDLDVAGVFVKTPVFPFVRFPGVDTILGPEMKSTGEVMGGASNFGAAFAKAQLAAGQRLPDKGRAFISVNDDDKPNVIPVARDLAELGFTLVASRGTAGLPARTWVSS